MKGSSHLVSPPSLFEFPAAAQTAASRQLDVTGFQSKMTAASGISIRAEHELHRSTHASFLSMGFTLRVCAYGPSRRMQC